MGPGFVSPDFDEQETGRTVFKFLQWGRASSARISIHPTSPHTARDPSMGPGFVSPDFTPVTGETMRYLTFNGAGLRQPGFRALPVQNTDLATLQWGRASSARISSSTM